MREDGSLLGLGSFLLWSVRYSGQRCFRDVQWFCEDWEDCSSSLLPVVWVGFIKCGSMAVDLEQDLLASYTRMEGRLHTLRQGVFFLYLSLFFLPGSSRT